MGLSRGGGGKWEMGVRGRGRAGPDSSMTSAVAWLELPLLLVLHIRRVVGNIPHLLTPFNSLRHKKSLRKHNHYFISYFCESLREKKLHARLQIFRPYSPRLRFLSWILQISFLFERLTKIHYVRKRYDVNFFHWGF